jgi:hypothetical protein
MRWEELVLEDSLGHNSIAGKPGLQRNTLSQKEKEQA